MKIVKSIREAHDHFHQSPGDRCICAGKQKSKTVESFPDAKQFFEEEEE